MDNLNTELILHRLDDIAKKQDELNKKVEELTVGLAKLKTIEISVDNIKEWKERLQDVVSTTELKDIKYWKKEMEERMSPTQLDSFIKEHEILKTFKTQAMMIWVIAQALMTIMIFWDKIFN